MAEEKFISSSSDESWSQAPSPLFQEKKTNMYGSARQDTDHCLILFE